jgi:hypothetical protein
MVLNLIDIKQVWCQADCYDLRSESLGKVDLTKAYAWSALAAEGGEEHFVNESNELLQRTSDQSRALNSAGRLKKKFVVEALKSKADRKGRGD